MSRAYDLVLWGGTGFTGKLVANHLSKTYPDTLRWAFAGRNKAKLEATHTELKLPSSVPVLSADPMDAAALDKLLSQGTVVLAMAGPYELYGKPVVASAVRCGTHYCDITGEAGFMRHVIDTHDAAAKANKCCVVSACGYDSVPWDLGALLALRALGPLPEGASVAVDGFVGSSYGGVSGGTLASLFAASTDVPPAANLRASTALDPGWGPRPAPTPQLLPKWSPTAAKWTFPSVMAVVNEKIVYRSASLLPAVYGPRGCFAYRESTLAPAGGFVIGGAAAAAATAALALGLAAVSLRPARAVLLSTGLLPSPGQGPSQAVQSAGKFNAHFVATTDISPALRAASFVSKTGADPGYGATCIMASEAALCLALDMDKCPPLARGGGCLTPATAMGEALVARLKARGFVFEAKKLADGEAALLGV